VAGRPSRSDPFGAQEVERESVTYWLDKRITAAIRELAKVRLPHRGAPKPTASSIAEGAFFRGLWCLHFHQEEDGPALNCSWDEAKKEGLSLARFEKIGTIQPDGTYRPDSPEDYQPRKPKRRRRRSK
jgi:hypothetical protein